LPIEQNPWIDECRDNDEPSKKRQKAYIKNLQWQVPTFLLNTPKRKKRKRLLNSVPWLRPAFFFFFNLQNEKVKERRRSKKWSRKHGLPSRPKRKNFEPLERTDMIWWGVESSGTWYWHGSIKKQGPKHMEHWFLIEPDQYPVKTDPFLPPPFLQICNNIKTYRKERKADNMHQWIRMKAKYSTKNVTGYSSNVKKVDRDCERGKKGEESHVLKKMGMLCSQHEQK